MRLKVRIRAREKDRKGNGAETETNTDLGSIHNSVQENTMVLRLKWKHWGKSRAWYTRNGNMNASRKKVQEDFKSRKITEHQFVNGLDSGSYCKKMLSPFSALCLTSALIHLFCWRSLSPYPTPRDIWSWLEFWLLWLDGSGLLAYASV